MGRRGLVVSYCCLSWLGCDCGAMSDWMKRVYVGGFHFSVPSPSSAGGNYPHHLNEVARSWAWSSPVYDALLLVTIRADSYRGREKQLVNLPGAQSTCSTRVTACKMPLAIWLL